MRVKVKRRVVQFTDTSSSPTAIAVAGVDIAEDIDQNQNGPYGSKDSKNQKRPGPFKLSLRLSPRPGAKCKSEIVTGRKRRKDHRSYDGHGSWPAICSWPTAQRSTPRRVGCGVWVGVRGMWPGTVHLALEARRRASKVKQVQGRRAQWYFR